ncbi:MAG: Crp/Fnr family transcriptional regulator, partial [Bacteroidota bacterium]
FTTDFFFENEFVGNYISYQTQSPSPSATEALEPSELIVIPFAQFEKLYESIPATQEVAEIIGKRKLLRMHKRSSSLLMDSPEERYYRLMELQPMIFQRVPQYLIAQYLGIRPESLSRIRRRHKS